MFSYKDYAPYVCFGVALFALFVLWYFYGGKKYDFVGLGPLDPNTRADYVAGSMYDWGNQVCEQEIQEQEQEDDFRDAAPEERIDITPEINDEEQVCIVQQEDLRGEEIQVCIPEKKPKKKKAKFISKGERMCKETMEKFYGAKFENVRPSWLKNPETGRALELDCYNEDLKIAVEYNGEQHYKWPNFTNQSKEEFINQTRRDMLKAELCEKNGIYLIVVPYNVPHEKISSYIISKLPENNI